MARLFGRQNEESKYPWESPEKDLAEARRLIEKHGYLRRMEELEDAEASIKPGKINAWQLGRLTYSKILRFLPFNVRSIGNLFRRRDLNRK